MKLKNGGPKVAVFASHVSARRELVRDEVPIALVFADLQLELLHDLRYRFADVAYHRARERI